jgi:3-oxoacyl-[acyl-carrier-protein] synthase-3
MNTGAYITRSASFFPLDPVENAGIEAVLGCAGGRPSRTRGITLRHNGITSRHYAIDPLSGRVCYTNAQLTAEAVRRLEGDGVSLNDLQCLVTGTSIPDQILPNHGVMVHGELRCPACEVVSTAGVCVSGVTALKYAWLSVRAGEHTRVVATGSEVVSPLLRAERFAAESEHRAAALEVHPELAFEKDFLRWMLSDAAGALWLQNEPDPSRLSLRIDWIDIASYAHEMPVCMYAGAERNPDGTITGWAQFGHDEIGERSIFAIKQDVKLLNANIAEFCLERPLGAIIARRGLRSEDVNWFLPHMSSEFFRPRMAEALARIGFPIPPDRWFTNLFEKGNVGSASIYVMLDELLRGGRLRRGDRLLGFVPESGRFSAAFLHFTAV